MLLESLSPKKKLCITFIFLVILPFISALSIEEIGDFYKTEVLAWYGSVILLVLLVYSIDKATKRRDRGRKRFLITPLLYVFAILLFSSLPLVSALIDSTVYDPVTNVCTGTRLGMNVIISPCLVQDADGKNIVQDVSFIWSGVSAKNVSWVFAYPSQIDSGSVLVSVNGSYVDKTDQMSFLGDNLRGEGKSYYRVSDVLFSPNQTIHTRWIFTPEDATVSGKWEIIGYNSNLGLLPSISADQYIYIDPWWNNSWLKKQNVSGFTTRYAVFNVTHNSDMQADFDDIRFLDHTDSIELNFSIRDKVNSQWAVFMVDVNDNSSIQMYYDNDAATSGSSIASLFGINLISYFTLDENSGTAVTDLVGDNNATANTGILDGTTGNITYASNFTLNSGFIDVNNGIATSISSGDFTMSMKLYITDTSGTYRPLYIGGQASARDYIQFDTSSSTTFTVYGKDGTIGLDSITAPVNEDEWVHVTLTRTGTTVKLYLNATEYATGSGGEWGVDLDAVTPHVEIGKNTINSLEYEGYIDEVLFASRAYSDAQILDLFEMQMISPTFGSAESNNVGPQFNSYPTNESIDWGSTWTGLDYNLTNNSDDEGGWTVNDSLFTINSTGFLTQSGGALPAGDYYVLVNVTDGDGAFNTTVYKLTVNKNANEYAIFLNESDPIAYDTFFTVWFNASTDAVLYRNGTQIANASVQNGSATLSSGIWNFTAIRNDTVNYSNVTVTRLVQINSAISIDNITNSYSAGGRYKLGSDRSYYQRVGQKINVSDFDMYEIGFYVQRPQDYLYILEEELINYYTNVHDNADDVSGFCYNRSFDGSLNVTGLSFWLGFTLDAGESYLLNYSIRYINGTALINEQGANGSSTVNPNEWMAYNFSSSVYLDTGIYSFCVYSVNTTGTDFYSWTLGKGSDNVSLSNVSEKWSSTALTYDADDEPLIRFYIDESTSTYVPSGNVNYSVRYTANDSLLHTQLYGDAYDFSQNDGSPSLLRLNLTSYYTINDEYYFTVDYNGSSYLDVYAGQVRNNENQATYNATDVSYTDQSNDLGYFIGGRSNQVCSAEYRYLCTNEADCEGDGAGYWYNNECNDAPESVSEAVNGGGGLTEEQLRALWWQLFLEFRPLNEVAFAYDPIYYEVIQDVWSDLWSGSNIDDFPFNLWRLIGAFLNFILRSGGTGSLLAP